LKRGFLVNFNIFRDLIESPSHLISCINYKIKEGKVMNSRVGLYEMLKILFVSLEKFNSLILCAFWKDGYVDIHGFEVRRNICSSDSDK